MHIFSEFCFQSLIKSLAESEELEYLILKSNLNFSTIILSHALDFLLFFNRSSTMSSN